jgi:oligosaccharide translocation protein RFT1
MYILTEGQKFVLKFTQSLPNQALFSVCQNLGSLAARFVFLPVEQASQTLFSKYADVGPARAAAFLCLLLKAMIHIGLCFVCFGPAYSFLLLDLLYGARYSATAAPALLAAYCPYVALIAINGITEAFTRAVATASDIKIYNYLLIVFSGIFLSAAVGLIQYFGTIGLLIAECINMTLRIGYCSRFIFRFFNRQSSSARKGTGNEKLFHLGKCVPSFPVFVWFGLCLVFTHLSERYFLPQKPIYSLAQFLAHGLFGAFCFIVLIVLVVFTEREFLRELVQLWRMGKQPLPAEKINEEKED